MALIDSESFDGWGASDWVARGWHTGSGASIGAVGRFGSGGINSLYDQFHTARVFPTALTSGIIGVAQYYGTAAVSAGIFTMYQGGYSVGLPQICLRINNGGLLEVWRGNSSTILGTLLGTGTTPFPAGQYRYFEMKFTINDTTGSVVVRVNGITELSLSGIDTQNPNSSGNNVDSFRMGYTGSGVANGAYFDDYYLCDLTGSAPQNDFLGDVRVQNLLPNGNGATSTLDGSDGNTTDNFQLVDDPTAPDGETTYVESSDVGDKDTYAYENLTPTTGTVYGVIVRPYARKTDAGTRNIATIARLSTTEEDSSDILLSSNYTYHQKVYQTKPGGGAWTISDVNSAEFGVKVTA